MQFPGFPPRRAGARNKADFTLHRRPLPLVLTFAAWSAFGAVGLHAQTTLTWDANTATAGAQDGAGTWNTTGANWYNGSADVTWPNDTSTALFGAGTAGTYAITVGTVNAGGITFNQNGYTLSSGSITLKPVSATTGFVVTTNNGATGTISSTLAGTTGSRITKTGSGTLSASTPITGGTAASPTVGTITGGIFNGTTGIFDSVLQVSAANFFGAAPTSAATVITLDAGTLRFTQNGGNLLANTRGVQVNAAGGAIVDSGTVGSSTSATINGPIIDNAGATSSLYLSNSSGAFTGLTGLITGTGGITWNGLGTAVVSATNTYAGPTVVNKGTLRLASAAGYNGATVASGSLGNNSLTLATGATLSLQGAVLRFDLGNGADRLTLQTGSVNVSGVNNVRLATSGGSLVPGTYSLLTSTVGSLTGSFQFDGASTLTVPATTMVKQVGSTFYRLTLQNSSAAEQVVVTPASGVLINEMPLGSSITEGVSPQGATYAGGGYRSQLYQTLVNDGRFIPNFVGSNTVLDNAATAGYNVLSGANQLRHEGHGGYTTTNVLTNLNAGGNWLAPGNGVNPDYVTLSIGGNDYANSASETTGPVLRTDAIVSTIETLRPAAHVVLATLLYRIPPANNSSVIVGDLQNTYYNPAIPGVVYNHVLAGHHISFVDQYTAVTPGNVTANIIGSDGIHPLTPGYTMMANAWYNALAFGTAYWIGGQDNQWSTVTAGNATNFALNHPLTIPRQTSLDASTDVYFSNNSAALGTVLGADLAVRGVNFAAGATGPVTVGGGNTLTLNAGGVTVQAGTGAHTISANVALAADQTWGNVSANPFTVSGNISGARALTTTGSYTIQTQVSATSNAISPQTYTGTGSIVLSGANTYTGGTLVSSGTLAINNASGSGTGTGSVNVASGATLSNNGAIGGDVGLSGTANGNGAFGGAVTISNGGVLSGAATIGGALNVGGGGLVTLTSGTLSANGGVVNNGTIRLARGASLVVGNGVNFVNNGILDVITGSFSAPSGFTNNGVVIDSSAVRAKSVNLTGNALAIVVDGYTGHSYRLQRSNSLTGGTFTNLGTPQSGATGAALTFTDDISVSNQGFYRVVVDLD